MISGIIIGQDIVVDIILLGVMPPRRNVLFINDTQDDIVSLFNINVITT